MVELPEFVAARLEEEAASWLRVIQRGGPDAAVAKRRLVLCQAATQRLAEHRRAPAKGRSDTSVAPALERLALPYYDHPDYDPAWHPDRIRVQANPAADRLRERSCRPESSSF